MILTEEMFQKLRGQIHWVSPSRIKPKKIKSPKHYKYFKEHPDPDTDSKDNGNAFHMIFLQPELFETTYVCVKWDEFGADPKLNKDGSLNMQDKFNKSIVEKLTNDNPGKVLLMPNEAETVLAEKKSIYSLYNAESVINLKESYVEATFLAFARFDENDKFIEIVDFEPELFLAMTEKARWNYIPLLCRVDLANKTERFIADLKSTKDLSQSEFSRDIETFGYHIQAAMEIDILNAALRLPEEKKYETFIFVCVENHPPYDAIYFIPKEEDMSTNEGVKRVSLVDYGRKEYIKKLEWIKKSMTTGIWQGVAVSSTDYEGQDICRIDLPGWYKNQNPLIK
ncbi:MAG: PD-(D/E)XK nuclease-like domain-containing protein [Paludibacter sp.]|nr:PD-(D/E)XK nuclease-like domain-containing protein [Paludibacter sp.]